ncbi:malate synthase A [Diaminobutyricibacter tongyongensis]|uniref:Malate synthase n=1 Tax=Leifsonia tongyongensis TaxID=1268043 RepID=A0A6L9Y2K0_9MICO|nr:malate synthase A [Diaminobutyricibacter tongyongensis]NEN07889.1 malate synthase A [Diaminobutyricibacter tongyongensis]
MIEITGAIEDRFDEILTPEAIEFLRELHERFAARRHELLAERLRKRVDAANGRDPRFLSETEHIRADASWQVTGAGPGLEDRRVEITGPTDPKMTINALNSGAKVWLADLEDATSPTWANIIGGQLSLLDATRGELSYTGPEGKQYRVTAGATPTIVVRPRGWHLVEKHIAFTDRAGRSMAASASLVDFGLHFWHNAARLVAAGRGPYFYLPKLESREEARLWNDIFVFAQAYIGMPAGTIRATVLIETIQAAFEMEEILYELREHCAGLNAGRWDYIFSIIKTFRSRGRRFVFPDRKQITMTVPFMRAYTELLVATCHRRGAYAIGGMSAFIPNRRDPLVTEQALEKVGADKRREAADGFDGTWVAHPDLIATARAEFDAVLGARPNQLDRLREDVHVDGAQLLDIGSIGGEVTFDGVRDNVVVALRYIESWLRGIGAVAIDNLMEDAATAEISRSQLWQWIENRTVTAEGVLVDREEVSRILNDELARLGGTPGDRFAEAADVLTDVALQPEFPTFLTIGAYARYLVDDETSPALALAS